MSEPKDEENETKAAGEAPSEGVDTDDGGDEGEGDIEAIARRAAALGDEDELDRIAREEERKLAERRAKKRGKKGGLEVAASKKLAKIGTRAEPKRSVAVASDADPLIERTTKLSDWAKQNQKSVQLVGAVIAVALLGAAGLLYHQQKQETDASVLLAKAVADERARIGEKKEEDEDPTPMFKTFEERRSSALAKYRDIESKYPKTGAALLARLAEGSLLLDMKKPDEAASAFTDVKGSALAAADMEVKGRALEGLGFALEQKAKAGGDAAAQYDRALAVYKELEETVDVRGFKELALYHQARIHEDKGDKEKAKQILVDLKQRFEKPEETAGRPPIPAGPAFPYLREVAMDRLRAIDPEAAPKVGGMPGGGQQLSPAQIRKMMEEMQKKGGGGGAPPGGPPHGGPPHGGGAPR